MADPFIGQIRLFGFNFAPTGWAMCWGQLLPISQNTALFSLLGTTYGGDGKSTFALPDLRGRVPIGWGQGPGLANYSMGQEDGFESVTLTAPNLPAHTHALDVSTLSLTRNARTAGATTGAPAGNLPAVETSLTQSYSSAAPDADMSASAIAFSGGMTAAAAGGGQPHQNMQPYLALNFCIATQGIFPSRS